MTLTTALHCCIHQLAAENPGLVYCSITGFGQTGPYRTRGGYDVIAASLGGLLGVTGEAGGGPVKVVPV